tara:strand:- start:41966 stop:42931 length:966 start_codon:yes stop_codon:yes gene_type:complete
MSRKKAIIFGISGQDGSYLAKSLLSKGVKVFGTSRDAEVQEFSNLRKLGIKQQISFFSVAINDFGSVFQCIKKISPDVIYNLASQSSVALSFSQPHETMESIELGTLNILESIRLYGKEIKFYNACSSECFGDTGQEKADENTPFNPLSPYAVSKTAAYWMVKNYREAYDISACSGILFNHESPLRQDRFVTKKIINAAVTISKGDQRTLHLGNIDIVRDWGWAPDYVEAMRLMMENKRSEDFVVATGVSQSLKDFLEITFKYFNLNWEDHVTIDKGLYRPTDITVNMGNPKKIKEKLGWKANFSLKETINKIIEYVLKEK